MLKLPSSLNWLIKKRGRIDGSIQKIERYLETHRRSFEKYQELTSELSFLRETLTSIDTTLRLHELKIDPQNIPAIRGKNYLTDLPRGELSQLILERIGIAGGKPVSSKEIVDFILQDRKASGAPPMVRISLSLKVNRRLNGLYQNKKLIRHHPQQTHRHGWWTLASDTSQDIRTEGDDLDNIL
jgi:hypothetical protein